MHYKTTFFLFCLALLIPQSSVFAVENTNASDVFEDFKKLVGTYTKKKGADGGRIYYRLIANNSALLEEWKSASGREELTIFHMNNDDLMATHYCAANIQSTMKLVWPPQGRKLEFKLHSVSNLKTPESPHNSGFAYEFTEDGKIYRDEYWMKNSVQEHSSQVLIPIFNANQLP